MTAAWLLCSRKERFVTLRTASAFLIIFVPLVVFLLQSPSRPEQITSTSGQYSMARLTWVQALLAASSHAYAQESATSSAPADGLFNSAVPTSMDMSATTSESAQFTVPASADEGPNLLPNVKNSTAVQAQSVCPGYTASDVEHTTNGFKATLNLAGDAVRIVVKSEHLPI
jgi:hypothetical protein